MTPQEPLLVWEYIGHLPRSRIHCEGEKSLTITKAQCIELNFPTHIMHFCFSGVTPCISYFWMSSAASSSVAILCGWNINGVNDTHRTKTDIGNTITNIGNISVPCANRAALILGSTFKVRIIRLRKFLIDVKFNAMFSGCRLLEPAPIPWFSSPIQIMMQSWGESFGKYTFCLERW